MCFHKAAVACLASTAGATTRQIDGQPDITLGKIILDGGAFNDWFNFRHVPVLPIA
jgi:hypothetical protein